MSASPARSPSAAGRRASRSVGSSHERFQRFVSSMVATSGRRWPTPSGKGRPCRCRRGSYTRASCSRTGGAGEGRVGVGSASSAGLRASFVRRAGGVLSGSSRRREEGGRLLLGRPHGNGSGGVQYEPSLFRNGKLSSRTCDDEMKRSSAKGLATTSGTDIAASYRFASTLARLRSLPFEVKDASNDSSN